MFNKIQIGDTEVNMVAYAGCDIFFRMIFHEDPTRIQFSDKTDEAEAIYFFERMAFVMNMCAEKSLEEMKKLNEDAFIEWMCKFDRLSLINALPDVRKTYEGQMVTTSEAKKNTDQPSEE